MYITSFFQLLCTVMQDHFFKKYYFKTTHFIPGKILSVRTHGDIVNNILQSYSVYYAFRTNCAAKLPALLNRI